ncbi:MAG: FHA domain-containing protein, partial [Trebonia sp.]
SAPVPATQMPQSAPVRSAATGATGAAAVAEWTAVVTADRAYFDAIQAADGPDAAGIAFPAYYPQRRFRLAGTEVRIGRRSVSSGIDPEIDLSVPPADPGVSRLHAVLLKAPDGSWTVVDPGSANGTAVNGSEIPQGQAVPLRDGDRIHLGAWTELRVVRGA